MKKEFYPLPFLSPRSERSLQELGILPIFRALIDLMLNLPKSIRASVLMDI
jgi:hypothetical protein